MPNKKIFKADSPKTDFDLSAQALTEQLITQTSEAGTAGVEHAGIILSTLWAALCWNLNQHHTFSKQTAVT